MDCCCRGGDDDTITITDNGVTMKTKVSSVLPRSEQHEVNGQQEVCDKQSEETARERAPQTTEPTPQQTAEETDAGKMAAQEAAAKKLLDDLTSKDIATASSYHGLLSARVPGRTFEEATWRIGPPLNGKIGKSYIIQ